MHFISIFTGSTNVCVGCRDTFTVSCSGQVTHSYCFCRWWKAPCYCERRWAPTSSEILQEMVSKMITWKKLSFIPLAVPMAGMAGSQEVSQELQAPAWWHAMSPPWSQPTFTHSFPPPTCHEQHSSEREEEHTFSCSLCGTRFLSNHMDLYHFSQPVWCSCCNPDLCWALSSSQPLHEEMKQV